MLKYQTVCYCSASIALRKRKRGGKKVEKHSPYLISQSAVFILLRFINSKATGKC